MKALTLCLSLAAGLFADDPKHVLPATPVTIHATMSALDAYEAVGKILGVRIRPTTKIDTKDRKPDAKFEERRRALIAALKSRQVTLDLDNATGAEAFGAISNTAHLHWFALLTADANIGAIVNIIITNEPDRDRGAPNGTPQPSDVKLN